MIWGLSQTELISLSEMTLCRVFPLHFRNFSFVASPDFEAFHFLPICQLILGQKSDVCLNKWIWQLQSAFVGSTEGDGAVGGAGFSQDLVPGGVPILPRHLLWPQ